MRLLETGNSAARRRAGSLAVVGIATLILTVCGESRTGPQYASTAAAGRASLVLAPGLTPDQHALFQASGLSIDNVHIVLRGADGKIVLDTVVTFLPGQNEVAVAAVVAVHGESEQFGVRFQLRSGTTTMFEGTQDLQVKPGTNPPSATPIVLAFVGPGATAVRVVVTPASSTLLAGAATQLSATAFDAAGAVIAGAPLVWTSGNVALAAVSSSGLVTAGALRGTTTVSASVLTGVSGSGAVSVTLPAARIVLTGGDAQTGRVGTTLTQAFGVQVQAADGVGVGGVSVAFSAVADGAVVGGATATTDADGRASTTMTLGMTLGSQSFRATASVGVVSVAATATVGLASAIAIVSGNAQADTIGKPLPLPLTVKVTDSFGNPVPGTTVAWARTAGAGAVASGSTTTDANGQTAIGYSLGNTPGAEVISGTLTGAGSSGASVTFSATAIARPASSLVAVSGGGQTGVVGSSAAQPLVVRASDNVGNPVAGATITWTATGGATVGSASTTTGADGRSQVTASYGTAPGAKSVTATLAGPTSASAAFSLTATIGPAASIGAVAGFGQTAPSGAAVTVAPAVRITDAFGNPFAGIAVTFAASGGGSVTGSPATTNASGVATVGSWTLGPTPGAQSLTATAGALTVQIPATATAPAGIGYLWLGVNSTWTNPANWSPAGVPGPADSVKIPYGPISPSITAPVTIKHLVVDGCVTVNNTSTLTILGNLNDTGCALASVRTSAGSSAGSSARFSARSSGGSPAYSISGTGIIVLSGTGTVQGELGNNVTVIGGTRTVLSGLTMFGSLTVSSGLLDVNSTFVSVSGSMATTGTGVIKMITSSSQLSVQGAATFGGGSETGLLTDGTFYLWNGLTQSGGSTSAFAPSGAFKAIIYNGGIHNISFANPTTSFFQNVDISNNTQMFLVTDALVKGTLAFTSTGSKVSATAGGTTRALSVSGLTTSVTYPALVQNVALKLVDGTANTAFNYVQFTGYPASFTGVALEVQRSSGSLTFDRLDFASLIPLGGGGRMLRNSGAANVSLTNPTPLSATAVFDATSSGTVTWPSVPPLVFAKISAGQHHICGVTAGGAAYCWGHDGYGQLGDGKTTSSPVPVAVAGGLSFAMVSANSYFTCGVTTGGAAYCWGYNGYGQFGNGTTTNSSTPVAVTGGLTFTAVSADGDQQSCGVTTIGAAYCQGSGFWGQLGNGATTDRSTPIAVAGGLTFATVVTGFQHTCGVTLSGAAYCWGRNNFGQLGDGTTVTRPSPVAVAGGLSFTTLSPGGSHTCGVTASGAMKCWGANANGQLGNGTTTDSPTPITVAGGLNFAALGAGGSHSCGVTTSGAAYCWGYNLYGQLGNGATTDSSMPVAVAGGLSFAAVTAGYLQTCGRTTSGVAYCWGFNDVGQLGNGTTTDSAIPVKVLGQP